MDLLKSDATNVQYDSIELLFGIGTLTKVSYPFTKSQKSLTANQYSGAAIRSPFRQSHDNFETRSNCKFTDVDDDECMSQLRNKIPKISRICVDLKMN